jgi:hypothetical protein
MSSEFLSDFISIELKKNTTENNPDLAEQGIFLPPRPSDRLRARGGSLLHYLLSSIHLVHLHGGESHLVSIATLVIGTA